MVIAGLGISLGQSGKWTRIYRTCTSKSKRGVMEAEAARRRRKGTEILPPNSASTDSSASLIPFPFPVPFEHLRLAEDSPFQTKPEVKRRRVYFMLTSPPLIPDFSSSFTFHTLLAWSIASTLFLIPFAWCIGKYGLLLPGTLTFLSCETRAFGRFSFKGLIWMKVLPSRHFVSAI